MPKKSTRRTKKSEPVVPVSDIEIAFENIYPETEDIVNTNDTMNTRAISDEITNTEIPDTEDSDSSETQETEQPVVIDEQSDGVEHVTFQIEEFEPEVPVPEDPVPEVPVQEVIPKVVFIVPYRNRESQLKEFQEYINKSLMRNDYRVFIVHQQDTRAFNRGAIKNIGFMVVKQLYPYDYKNITLVFNDIDTIPKVSYMYETVRNKVKHFYGFNNTLGGIVSITGSDFEKVNGFPNYWGWGYEDNMLQRRVLNNKITIDRTSFEKYMSPKVEQKETSYERQVSRADFQRYLHNVNEGINTITNLKYEIHGLFVDVTEFDTGIAYDPTAQETYDIRRGQIPFKEMIPTPRRNPIMKMSFL